MPATFLAALAAKASSRDRRAPGGYELCPDGDVDGSAAVGSVVDGRPGSPEGASKETPDARAVASGTTQVQPGSTGGCRSSGSGKGPDLNAPVATPKERVSTFLDDPIKGLFLGVTSISALAAAIDSDPAAQEEGGRSASSALRGVAEALGHLEDRLNGLSVGTLLLPFENGRNPGEAEARWRKRGAPLERKLALAHNLRRRLMVAAAEVFAELVERSE
jgi:hypothetical protein